MKTDGRFFNIRPSQDGDEEGFKELFKICFGREMSHDEWIWKYRNSYCGTSSVVTEYNGKIIGHYGGIRTNFYYNDKVFQALQGCDAMTHPDYRGQGIIVKTALLFYEVNSNVDFMFGFPSESHAIISAKWLGWENYRFIVEMMKKTVISKTFFNKWKIATGWDKISDLEINSLCEEIKELKFFSIIKNSNYIFWRYRDNPCKEYKLIVFRSFFTGKLKGFAVIHEQGDELRVLDIIISRKLNIKTVINLLEQKTLELGLKTIRIWINKNTPQYKELKNNGYSEQKGIPYAVKFFKKSLVQPNTFLDNYNYSFGDYDAA